MAAEATRSQKRKKRKEQGEWPRELDGPRLEPRAAQAKHLVVFLHGYGADGNDLIDIGRAWQSAAAGRRLRVAARAASRAARRRSGAQWFPLTIRDPNERWVGVNRPAPVLEHFLDAELARRNLPPSALALVGFSQGTMMALHVGLRRAVAPAAIVGYSGMLVLPDKVRAGRVRRRDQVASRRCC